MFPGLSILASAAAAATLNAGESGGLLPQDRRRLDGRLAEDPARSPQPPLPPPLAENRIAVDRVVREGDVIAVDEPSWRGVGDARPQRLQHQPARCGRSGVLVISDATGYYLPESRTWWPNYFSGYAAYVASIERLAALDAEIALPEPQRRHGRRGRMSESTSHGALAATRQYHDRIVAETKGRASPPANLPRNWGPRFTGRRRCCRWISSRRTAAC